MKKNLRQINQVQLLLYVQLILDFLKGKNSIIPSRFTIVMVLIFTSISLKAQVLHTTPSCSGSDVVYSLDWSSNTWTTNGALSNTNSNVGGSGLDITWAISGQTGTFGVWTNQTPSVTTNPDDGGNDVLSLFSNGFNNGTNITFTFTFSSPVDNVAFDLYHVNASAPNGDKFTISAALNGGGSATPTFTASAGPQWSDLGGGVVDATGSGTAGQIDQVGVNFSATDITSITIVWENCNSCSNAVHGFGIGDIDFCGPIADNDGDGIADATDIDDDNDGILDTDECSNAIQVDIDLDEYENETSWTLADPNGTTVASGGTYLDSDELISVSTNVNLGGNYTFSIFDSFGDGMFFTGGSNSNGTASYSLSLNGTQVFTSGNNPNFGSSDQQTVAATCDTDGDGIDDYYDLDSDNDGIPDIVEAGGTDSDNDGVVDGAFADADGDGWANTFDPDIGGTPLTDGDQDGDGVENRIDLDADNDGIADIIEAGGTDANNDGVVDTSTDDDNDGWANTFDSDNSGTALAVTNTDATGNPDYLDIDSDDDGIVDVIESQATGALTAPSGTDSDGDGIDDNFDSDSGNSLTNPVDVDGDAIDDYQDTNSDNDLLSDAIEGYDTNGDGVSDTAPGGSDTDGDGLLDGYDNLTSAPANSASTNVTNNGQTSSSFPNDETPGTAERDWRETADMDGDGVADDIDVDSDNDGIPDSEESVCTAPEAYFLDAPQAYWSLDNNTNDVSGNGNNERSNGAAPGFSTTAIQGTHSANFNGSSNTIRYSQNGGFMESSYTTVSFSAWIQPDNLTGSRIIYEEGGATNGLTLWLNGGTLTYSARSGGAGSQTDIAHPNTITLDNQWHHVAATFNSGAMIVYLDGVAATTTAAFSSIPGHGSDGGLGGPIGGGTSGNVSDYYSGLMDAVRYSHQEVWSANRIGYEGQKHCDADGDGIPNHLDIDSDNDGVPDIIEAGGTDSNNDGVVDSGTDTDGDGYANVFDSNDGGTALTVANSDGSGNADFLDIDSDDDGIPDIIEAGGTDANNDGVVDAATDGDSDGWANTFDSNNGGTALSYTDTDGDGLANYQDVDSDNDGLTDAREAYTTAAFMNLVGTDSDGDGWDNRFDSDDGGTAITLSNNESSGNPDYIDTDSDGDGQLDWLEGFDDDEDGDALNDLIARANTFEIAAGSPGYYVSSTDSDMDNIPDFLEDADMDNVPNFLDPNSAFFRDTDNDGLVDLFDTDNFGVASILPNGDGDANPDWRDTDDAITLPIDLLSFEALKNGEVVDLEWETIAEINNDFFTIERSSDLLNFEAIAFIDGAGNHQGRLEYLHTDEAPLEGVSYYRLKQTDFNGDFSYSDVRSVRFDLEAAYAIYPNPSNGESLFLSSKGLNKPIRRLSLLSAEGAQLMDLQVQMMEEQLVDLTTLLPTQLKSGWYFLVVVDERGVRQTLKFAIIK